MHSNPNENESLPYFDLDPVVDMVISLIGLLEHDLFTPVTTLNMVSFQSVFLPSNEDLLEAMTEFCPLTWCHSRALSSLIQVDIGGHPPFPTGSKQFSGNFGNLLFLAGFNFRGHFEGLNEGFLRSRFSMIAEVIIEPQK